MHIIALDLSQAMMFSHSGCIGDRMEGLERWIFGAAGRRERIPFDFVSNPGIR
jgi:hypothetical protein